MSEHTKDLPPHLMPVRFSRLKLMGKSPAHYRAQFERPTPDDQAKRAGRLAHALLLGGGYVVYPGKRREGNAWAEFKAANAGKEIALRSELDEAMRVAESVNRHADARRLLFGIHECEIAWMNDGRACGARLDVIGRDYVTDLKTTASAEPGWFTRNAARMGYHAQLAWYKQGAEIALGRAFQRAYIVAVEARFPYVVTCFELSLAALDNGERLWRSWWEMLMNCERSDAWPPYALGVQNFDVRSDAEIDFDE
jgi:hypothetical protein